TDPLPLTEELRSSLTPSHPKVMLCFPTALKGRLEASEETSPSLDRFFSMNGEALYFNFPVNIQKIPIKT
uniref:hypothetical protein n=1 Tax=Okeania sp. SIO2F4 TaxID=2607790 RepID=UPI0025EEE12A